MIPAAPATANARLSGQYGPETAAMVQQLIEAAEAGYPGDRQAQIRHVAALATQLPVGFAGVFLTALKILTQTRACPDLKRRKDVIAVR